MKFRRFKVQFRRLKVKFSRVMSSRSVGVDVRVRDLILVGAFLDVLLGLALLFQMR